MKHDACGDISIINKLKHNLERWHLATRVKVRIKTGEHVMAAERPCDVDDADGDRRPGGGDERPVHRSRVL